MIRQLSDDVRGRLRTGVALTNVAQCVEELVLNSVDAGATCIAVRVDLQSLKIQVVDNGSGITKEQLSLVGERYATSKCQAVEDLDNLRYFGYRGEALASLCSASTFVEITTRPTYSTATLCKCFHKGKQLAVTEPSGPRAGTGTTVTVHNLFYNLPVRKKLVKEGLELEKIRYRVAGQALMWPLISFSLRDDVTGNVILQTRKCSGSLTTFCSLFGEGRAKHMREVETQDNIFKVSGYVSRENYSRPDLQFVFVNRRLVLKSKVHKLLNGVLGKSVLVRRRGNNAADKYSRQYGQDRSPGGDGGSPTKLFERYAVYVINIDCPLSAYDITFDPAKTLVEFHNWSELTKLVESMLMVFLKEENLLPSGEWKDSEQAGTSDVTAAIEGPSSTSPDEVGYMEDPFAGAEEGYDEEFHDNLQMKNYAQGISTYNNTNSLFSHAVRRPIQQYEKEGFDDLEVSSPKKSRQESDISGTSIQTQQHERETELKSYNIVSKGVPARKFPAGGTSSMTPKRDLTMECSTAGSSNNPAENTDDEDDVISLPAVAPPAKRSAHREAPTRQLPSQVSSSSSSSDLKEICLPSQFAHTSSLSCLRARLAGKTMPSTSSGSRKTTSVCAASLHKFKRSKTQRHSRESICDKTFKMTSDILKEGVLPSFTSPGSKKLTSVCSSSLHKLKRSENQRGNTETSCEENYVAASETINEIVLPPLERPPLFRSKSLDSESFCHHRDGRLICRRQSASFRHVCKSQIQVSDDTCVKYISNETSDKNRSRLKESRGASASCVYSSRDCADTCVSAMQNESIDVSRNSHHLHFSLVRHSAHDDDEHTLSAVIANRSHMQSISADKNEEIFVPPRKQIMANKETKSRNTRSKVHQPSAYKSADTDQVPDLGSTMTRLSEFERPALVPPQNDEPPAWLSSCQPSSSLVGPSQNMCQPASCTQSPPKPRGLSQASKLARLMNRGEVPSSDSGIMGSMEEADHKESNQRAHNTSTERSKKAFHPELNPYTQTRDSAVQSLHAFHGHDLQDGEVQVHGFQDLTALEMLSNTSSAQNCPLSGMHNQHAVESRRQQFPHLSLAQTCTEALGDCKNKKQSDACNTPAFGIQRIIASRSLLDDVTSVSSLPITGESNVSSLTASREHKNTYLDPNIKANSDAAVSRRQSRSFADNYSTAPEYGASFCATENAEESDVPQGLLGSVKPARVATDQNSSGDAPEPHGSHFHVESLSSSQETNAVRLPLIASPRTLSLNRDSCGRSIDKEQLFPSQQETQGFAAVCSQGFAPQLAEEGSMPFTASEKVLTCPVQTDSPVSTGSVGFSPTANDPLLPECDTKSVADSETETPATRPVEISKDAEGTEHCQSESPTNSLTADCSGKETVTDNTSVYDPVAKNTISALVQEKKTEFISSVVYKLSVARENTRRSIPAQILVSSADELPISHQDRSIDALSRKKSLVQSSESEHENLTVFTHQPSSLTMNISASSVQAAQKQIQALLPVHLGRMSHKDNATESFCSNVDSLESQKDAIFLTSRNRKDETHSLEIPLKKRVSSSKSVSIDSQDLATEVSSLCASSSTNMSCTSGNQASQPVLCAEPALSAQETAQLSQDHKLTATLHSKNVRAHTIGENKTEQKQAYDELSSDSVILTSESEPRLSVNIASSPGSSWTGTQTQQKSPVEQTYNLSFLSGTKFKSLLSSCTSSPTPSMTAEKKNQSLTSDSLTCFERTQPECQVQMSVKESEKDSSVCTQVSQQSGSCGDSVGQCALPGSLMPTSSKACSTAVTHVGSQHLEPASKTSIEVQSPASLVPSTVQTKHTPSVCRSLTSHTSVSDSDLAKILTPQEQTSRKTDDGAELGHDSQGSVSDSVLANMVIPENHISQLTKPSSSVFSQSPPNSVPDCVIIQAQEEEESATQAVVGTSNSDPDFHSSESYTLSTSDSLDLSVNSVPFTQNTYNLPSALSFTPSNGISDEASFKSQILPHDASAPNVDAAEKVQVEATGSELCDSHEVMQSLQTDLSCEEDMADMEGGSSTNIKPDTRADVGEEEERRKEGIREETTDVVWIPVTDPVTGGTVYMNSSSGHTLSETQWNQKRTELGHAVSHAAVAGHSLTSSALTHHPKETDLRELSPLSLQTIEALLADYSEADEEAANLKWRKGSKNMVCEYSSGKSVLDILNTWENPVFKRPEQMLQPVQRMQAGKVARSFFHPTTFTKAMLTNCKVIGQLDNKFVACLIQEGDVPLPIAGLSSDDSGEGGLVVLFDQHAAHERIRLEQLISAVYEKNANGGTEERRIRRTDVKPPRMVFASEEDVRIMLSFREEFDRIGIVFDADPHHRDRVHVHTIPACMAQREANEMKRGKDPRFFQYLEVLLREHTQLLLSTGGAKHQLPQQVHRLLATHACKGAIKFGDKLSVATCQSLLSTLSSCDLPFQCAHGRPSITPLISLRQLKLHAGDKKPPLNLWKLGRRKSPFPGCKDQ